MPMSDEDISRKFRLLTKTATIPDRLLSDLMEMEKSEFLPLMV